MRLIIVLLISKYSSTIIDNILHEKKQTLKPKNIHIIFISNDEIQMVLLLHGYQMNS